MMASVHATPGTEPSGESEGAPATPSPLRRFLGWKRWLLWVLAFLPVAACGILMRAHCVNQRFNDDWMFVPDLVKYHDGKLGWSDLWAAQMEHRSPLPRLLALGTTLWFQGDTQVQNGLTFVQICGLAVMAAILLARSARLVGKRSSPGLLFLVLLVLCSAVQWQPLLWAVLFFAWMPVFFLATAICLLTWEKLPWKLRLAGWLVCAVAGSLSFASGLLVWILPWMVLLPLWFEKVTWRWRWAAVWAALFAGFLFCYFHNIHNSVDQAFSYGQGHENAVSGDLKKFAAEAHRLPGFVLAFVGAALSRGFFCDHVPVAMVFGALQILAWVSLLVFTLWRGRDPSLRRAVLPWLAVAAYTPCMACMVAVGRLWVSSSLTLAFYNRYSMQQFVMAWALVPAVALVLRDLSTRPSPRGSLWASRAAHGLTASFLLLMAAGWTYGMSLMGQWKAARLRDASAQLFSNMDPRPDYFRLSQCPYSMWKGGILSFLDQHHYLAHPLLTSRDLSRLSVKKELKSDEARLTSLQRVGDNIEAEGFALRPRARRTYDAILFTSRNKKGDPIIFGMTQPLGFPIFLHRAMAKDLEWTTEHHLSDPLNFGAWERVVALFEPPPEDLAKIEAWAFDFERFQVRRIPDLRKRGNSAPAPDLE